MGFFEKAHSPYYIYVRKFASLEVLTSLGDGVSPTSQRTSRGDVRRPVFDKEEVEEAVLESTGPVDKAIHLLKLDYLKRCHVLLANSSFYTLRLEKLYK